MNVRKRQRLERAGWTVADTSRFLGLSKEETRFLELKLALAAGVRDFRERRGMSQAEMAKRLGSSQSRVAKMESADASVSVDLMIKSLIGIGAGASDIASIIRRARPRRAA